MSKRTDIGIRCTVGMCANQHTRRFVAQQARKGLKQRVRFARPKWTFDQSGDAHEPRVFDRSNHDFLLRGQVSMKGVAPIVKALELFLRGQCLVFTVTLDISCGREQT